MQVAGQDTNVSQRWTGEAGCSAAELPLGHLQSGAELADSGHVAEGELIESRDEASSGCSSRSSACAICLEGIDSKILEALQQERSLRAAAPHPGQSSVWWLRIWKRDLAMPADRADVEGADASEAANAAEGAEEGAARRPVECLESFDVVLTGCGHAFHKSCYLSSLQAGLVRVGERRCAVCRGPLPHSLRKVNAELSLLQVLVDTMVPTRCRDLVVGLWFADGCTTATRAYFVGMITLVILVSTIHIAHALTAHKHKEEFVSPRLDPAWEAGRWWH
mmetsp:Transcript_7842/g.12470  ORF Transcript_7842/g.12470 Transcript_7842/m.12470 type:complete len:278 (+) Transcript_7842:209-1042(+)